MWQCWCYLKMEEEEEKLYGLYGQPLEPAERVPTLHRN